MPDERIGFDTNWSGDDTAEMVRQLQWIIDGVKSGDIVSYMAGGVHKSGDIWSAGLAPKDCNLDSLHEAIMHMHDVFHECVDSYIEEHDRASDSTDPEPSQH